MQRAPHCGHEPVADDSRWVLVVDGGKGQNRSALATVQALAAAGYRPAVTVSGGKSLAAASRFCRRIVPVPTVDHAGFAGAVHAEVAAHPYLTALPVSDAAILALDAPGGGLVDKVRLMRQAVAVGMTVPVSRWFDTSDSLVSVADDLDYPLTVKPALKTSARYRPARRVDFPDQLRSMRGGTDPMIVQPFLSGQMHSVSGVVWRGRLVAAVHQRYLRIWPRDCGDATAAVTTSPSPARERQLLRLLSGYEGIFQAEFLGPYLLDLNPRPYGSLPLAVSAGVNLVGIWCALLQGVSPQPSRAVPGVEYRWREGDARHLFNRWRAGESTLGSAVRSFQRDRNAPSGQPAARDVGPVLARLRFAGRRVLRPETTPLPPTVRRVEQLA